MILTHQRLLRLSSPFYGKAYIAGEGDGIVSIKGTPVVRQIVALEQDKLMQLASAATWSFPDGSYVLPNLDPTKEYIVFAYDYKGDYEPVAYSHIVPHLRT